MKPLRFTTAFIAALSGSLAQADVTAQQVWGKWTDQMAVYGQGFTTGGEVMSGNTLLVSDVAIEMTDGEATLTSRIGTIKLTENGDGTVSVSMPASYPVTLVVTPPVADPSTVNMLVTQDSMNLEVSGDPDAMDFVFSVDRYMFAVESLEGRVATKVDLERASLAMLDLNGSYSVANDNLTRIVAEFNLGALDLDVALTEPEGDNTINATLDLADLAAFGTFAAPIDMDLDADLPPFAEGLAFDAGYSYGNVSMSFDVNADGEIGSGSGSTAGGTLTTALDIDGGTYTTTSDDIAFNLLFPNEFPLPIEASLGSYGVDLQIPLSQAEDGGQRDMVLAMNISDLVISDALWNLVDPAGVLPRDPIAIALDLGAKVTPFFDFLDPEQQEALALSAVPGEINSATLTSLIVRGIGADISGEGAFTFDNTDMQTFPGFPRPQGEATFALNGINGLIDNLIQMGLIPQDQALVPRMMMGMFATPIGDDQLTSTIEINDEGHVVANGQRLR